MQDLQALSFLKVYICRCCFCQGGSKYKTYLDLTAQPDLLLPQDCWLGCWVSVVGAGFKNIRLGNISHSFSSALLLEYMVMRSALEHQSSCAQDCHHDGTLGQLFA